MNAVIVWLADLMTAPLLAILLIGVIACLAMILWMGLNIVQEVNRTMEQGVEVGPESTPRCECLTASHCQDLANCWKRNLGRP